MDRVATPFPIPKRTSLPRDARRRSLPAPSKQGARQPRSPRDRTNREPASPEVIASLISSLSAVSLPASEHFDDKTLFARASQSTPASPNAFRTTFAGRGDYSRRGSAVPPIPRPNHHIDSDAESFHDSVEYLHPNDAAAPPVIRTSKRNSGTYPFSDAAPNGGEPTPFWKRYARDDGVAHPERDVPNSAAAPTVDLMDRRRSSAASVARRHPKGPAHQSSPETIRDREGKRGLVAGGEPSGNLPPGQNDRGSDGRREKRASTSTYQPVGGATFDEKFFAFHVPDFSAPVTAEGRATTDGPSQEAQDVDPTLVPDGFVPARRASLRRASGPRAVGRDDADPSSAKKPDGGLEACDKTRREVDRTVSDLLDQTQYIGTSHTAETSNGAPLKRRKGPPESMVFSRSTKLRSPVGSPTIVPSPQQPTTKESGKENRPATAGGETRGTGEDDDSAPAPAVMQRRARDGPANTKSHGATYLQARSVSPAGRPSQESPQAPRPRAPTRRSSRIRRRSQPSDGKASQRHQRTFSNPLGRNSTSSARPPPIVVEDRPSTADSVEDAVDAYLCSPRLSQRIRHPETGRAISFSEVGDSEGFAVFCCVGMGLTRYIMTFYDELALTLKLRLITPDRPGVGDSEAHTDGTGTPLGWPDDVHAICQALKITKFSILAHSAGAIYALAIALRMPQQIRGRIHLLAPWIPPSQLSPIGSQQGIPPAGAVPTSQKILRALPTSLFKVANSSFMSATSSSLTRSVPKSPRRKRKSGINGRDSSKDGSPSTNQNTSPTPNHRDSLMYPRPTMTDNNNSHHHSSMTSPTYGAHRPDIPDLAPSSPTSSPSEQPPLESSMMDRERQSNYDARLAHAIWDLASTNANPAVDLLVCLERRQPIGFRYVDITRGVVIHHGSRDTRVPVENVRWLGKTMKRCEVRVLEGEGHGLMASGVVMGAVLMEIAREWEDWTSVVEKARGNGLHVLGVVDDDERER